jgi:hypothetical protein
VLPAYAEDIHNVDGGKDHKGVLQMKKVNFSVLGIAALALAFGLVFAGCGNGSTGGEYLLIWEDTSTTYVDITTACNNASISTTATGTGQGNSDTNDDDWTLIKGNDAKKFYLIIQSFGNFGDGYEFGSFEDCINATDGNDWAPDTLKAAARAASGNLPLAGFINFGTYRVIFVIMRNN